MKQKLAVITGADGGMGMEITRAVATAGYKVIMACRDPEIAEEKRQLIMRETGNIALESRFDQRIYQADRRGTVFFIFYGFFCQ